MTNVMILSEKLSKFQHLQTTATLYALNHNQYNTQLMSPWTSGLVKEFAFRFKKLFLWFWLPFRFLLAAATFVAYVVAGLVITLDLAVSLETTPPCSRLRWEKQQRNIQSLKSPQSCNHRYRDAHIQVCSDCSLYFFFICFFFLFIQSFYFFV